jgi:FG-GAP-like repeat
MMRSAASVLAALVLCGLAASAPASETGLPPSLPHGLLLALAQFEVMPNGTVSTKPGAARLEIVTRQDGRWTTQAIEDPDSNVFHKAMVYRPPGAAPGILTLGGNAAAIKLWRKGDSGFSSETVWQTAFGGEQNRMRDAEVGDLFGDGPYDIAVATHDQGVVAVVRPKKGGGFTVTELDRKPDTFVHEIEIGDLDGDGVAEVYATPSEPNRLDERQGGRVTRYVPAKKVGPVVVVDLPTRHAKEILVDDVDGDGRDELYVAVEAETEGKGDEMRIKRPVEIRRYDAGTTTPDGSLVAEIQDRFCRFLTAGDIDGDGKKEIVAAAFSSGLWLLRPPAKAGAAWTIESIDKDSSGFEHAALLTDLDGDGVDELYVASDRQGELRRYVWSKGTFERETILKRPVVGSVFTWNLAPVPADLVR